MAIETTLYDLIEAVSENCSDRNQVVAITQHLFNSRKVVSVSNSKTLEIVSLGVTQSLDEVSSPLPRSEKGGGKKESMKNNRCASNK